MNREEIMKILPHRDNMLLIDDAVNEDGTAVAHYTVRGDEFFLKGHLIFPLFLFRFFRSQRSCRSKHIYVRTKYIH